MGRKVGGEKIQKLNLHIGFHKTGTTTFQKTLSNNQGEFKYWGRPVGQNVGGARLVEGLAGSIFNPYVFKKRLESLSEEIIIFGSENNLISHENLLRPHPNSYRNLEHLFNSLSSVFDLEVFISTRNIQELILSRFLHDYRVGKVQVDIREIPIERLLTDLQECLTWEASCYYPNCKQRPFPLCRCAGQKKIPVSFYMDKELSKRLSFSYTSVNLISEFGEPSNRSKDFQRLIFESQIRFSSHDNSSVQLPTYTKGILLDEICHFLKENSS